MVARGFAVGAVALWLLAGCSQPGPDVEIFHVHGLHYAAGEDVLFVATHHGLVRGERSGGSWGWSFASAERYDYMGFTPDGNRSGTFYSSGHPDNPYQYGGTNLGLRRSTDGGVTWEQRSLKGEVDFHALTGVPGIEGAVVGWGKGKIMASANGGLNWTEHAGPNATVLALAATASTVWAGTNSGLYRSTDGLRSWQPIGGLVGGVVSLAVSQDSSVMMAAVQSERSGVYIAANTGGGALWRRATEPGLHEIEAPVVFAIDATDNGHAFASDAGGYIWETRDTGLTWKTIRS